MGSCPVFLRLLRNLRRCLPGKCLYQEGLYRAPSAEKNLTLDVQEATTENPRRHPDFAECS